MWYVIQRWLLHGSARHSFCSCYVCCANQELGVEGAKSKLLTCIFHSVSARVGLGIVQIDMFTSCRKLVLVLLFVFARPRPHALGQ